MVAAAILKNLKNCNISATDGPVSRKFGMAMCLDPPDLLSIEILRFLNRYKIGQTSKRL